MTNKAKKIIVGAVIGVILLILIVLGLFSSALKVFAAPGQTRTLHLQWDYSQSEVTNLLSFNVYSTNNIAAPTGTWPIYANVLAGANRVNTNAGVITFDLPMAAASQTLFFFCTASNAIGESLPTPIVAAPYPPAAPPALRIQ